MRFLAEKTPRPFEDRSRCSRAVHVRMLEKSSLVSDAPSAQPAICRCTSSGAPPSVAASPAQESRSMNTCAQCTLEDLFKASAMHARHSQPLSGPA